MGHLNAFISDKLPSDGGGLVGGLFVKCGEILWPTLIHTLQLAYPPLLPFSLVALGSRRVRQRFCNSQHGKRDRQLPTEYCRCESTYRLIEAVQLGYQASTPVTDYSATV